LWWIDQGRLIVAHKQQESAASVLELAPGGFAYHGKPYILTGRPRQMLKALLESKFLRLSRHDLRKAMNLDDERDGFHDQVVKDSALQLRRALRAAAGKRCDDPLPSIGRGDDLTYILDMPA
jgi:hypothetical protein